MKYSLFALFFIVITISFGQCPSGASPFTSGILTINSNQVYCLSSDLTVTDLTIQSGGKLHISTGKKLTVSNTLTVSGELTLEMNAGVATTNLIVGNGTNSHAIVQLGKKANLTIASNGGITQTTSTGSFMSQLVLNEGSVVEDCGTYQQVTQAYPFVKYVGSESSKAYLIVKKAMNGIGAGTHISYNREVVAIALSSVNGLTGGLSTFCGANATPEFCPSWPSGLSNNANECFSATSILANLPEPETTCHENTFTRSVDPNSIEYDNIVSGFHSTILKESNGTIKVWGLSSAPNGDAPSGANNGGTASHTLPKEVIPANGYNYTGVPLRVTGGSTAGAYLNTIKQQFILLTTTGLYAWGNPGTVVSESIKGTKEFGSVTVNGKADGLPAGVSPSQVKMLFGSHLTLAIVTYSGDAYVLSNLGAKNGDNTSNDHKWHRVKTDNSTYLTNVVAVRGNPRALVALTADGKMYTWGENVYLGNTNGPSNKSYATQMNLPTGITPKMIGMTIYKSGGQVRNSYYLLATNGELYSLGNNSKRQLGDFSTDERKSWVRVKSANNTNMTNVAWISPQEHDDNYPAVNALTTTGKLYSWGSNAGQMLGVGNDDSTHPIYMGRDLNNADVLLAVETGGHTTMIVRECTFKYGYLGHRVHGSMGDGTHENTNESKFNFSNTAIINLCGAPTAPIVKDLKFCEGLGQSVNLNDAFIGQVPVGENMVWYDASVMPNIVVTDFVLNTPGVYKAVYENSVCTDKPTATVNIGFYQSSDQPMYDQCLVILGKDLTAFNGSCNGNSVQLSWSTASESNLSHYEVMQSLDGVSWKEIGTVAATGTTKYASNYSMRTLTTGEVTYYRLKVVDADGYYEYSYPIVTNCQGSAIDAISVFPQPMSDETTVMLSSTMEESVQLTLTDLNGRVALTQTIQLQKGTNSFQLDVSQLMKGVYLLSIDLEGVAPVKLIKN